jgi:hypothetical protein
MLEKTDGAIKNGQSRENTGRFAPIPFRPGSFRPHLLIVLLKNEIWKIPLQIFVDALV